MYTFIFLINDIMNKENNLWSFKANSWNQWNEGLTVRQSLNFILEYLKERCFLDVDIKKSKKEKFKYHK